MKRVLCVGNATLDYIYRVHEMPSLPEKYRAQDCLVTGGGTAANAAVAIARLGGQVMLASNIGDDHFGNLIIDDLTREGVDCSLVRRVPGAGSPLSTILIDDAGERMLVSYTDPALAWRLEDLPHELPAGIDAVLGGTRWQNGTARFFRLARAAKIPAILDADRAPDEAPELVGLATHAAFSMQALRKLTGESDARRALEAFGTSASTWLAVTNGGEGVFYRNSGEIVHTPSFPVKAVDTLGAGDVWHGAFTLAIADRMSEYQAIRFASAAAAIKCTRFGGRGGAPTLLDVQDFLMKNRS